MTDKILVSREDIEAGAESLERYLCKQGCDGIVCCNPDGKKALAAFRAALSQPVQQERLEDYSRYQNTLGKSSAPVQQQEPLKEGYRLVAVNEAFIDLVLALERADRKGYLADALIEHWEAFDYEYADAHPAPADAAQTMWLKAINGALDESNKKLLVEKTALVEALESVREYIGSQPVKVTPFRIGSRTGYTFDKENNQVMRLIEKIDAALAAAMVKP